KTSYEIFTWLEFRRVLFRSNGVGFVTHGFHGGNRRANKVNVVVTTQSGKLAAFRQEADTRVQGVHFFVVGDTQHRFGVQVTFIRGVTTDTDHAVLRAEHIDRSRIHIGVGLNQHHLNIVFLRFADQFDRGTATGVNQDLVDLAEFLQLAGVFTGIRCQTFRGHEALQYTIQYVIDAVTGHRHIRVNGAQTFVQIVKERVAYQAVHGLR